MKAISIILLFTIFFPRLIQGQHTEIDSFKTILREKNIETKIELIESWTSLGNLSIDTENDLKFLQVPYLYYLDRNVEAIEILLDIDDKNLGTEDRSKKLYYLTIIYLEIGDFENAEISNNFNLLNYRGQRYNNRSLFLLAKIKSKKGEYQLSNKYIDQYYSDVLDLDTRFDLIALKAYNLIQVGSLSEAEELIISHVGYEEKISDTNKSDLVFRLAQLYYTTKEFEKAVLQNKRFIEFNRSSSLSSRDYNLSIGYSNLSNCYGKLGDEKVFEAVDSSFRYKSKLATVKYDPIYSTLYQSIAEFYLKHKEYNKALLLIDSSLFNESYQDICINQYPYCASFENISDKLSFIEILDVKLDIQREMKDHAMGETFFALDQMISLVKKLNFNDGSKFFNQNRYSKYYREAYRYFIQHEDYELALHYAQKTKGTILTESILDNRATVQLPDSLKLVYDELIDQKYILNGLAYGDFSNKDSVYIESSINEEKISRITKHIKDFYPQYFNRKFGKEAIPVEFIQNNLKPNEVMIDYLFDDMVLGRIMITTKDVEYEEIKVDSLLLLEIMNLKKVLANSPNPKTWTYERMDNLKEKLTVIGKNIFPTLPSRITDVIIIPDDLLSNFPIESLNHLEGQEQRYLVQDYNFSYNMSIPLWELSRRENKQHTYDGFGIINPFSDNQESDLYLPSAEKEIQSIKSNFEQKEFTDNLETAELIEQFSNYRFLHLTTHSKIDMNDIKNTYLLTGDEENDKLDYYSIINAYFPADLVSLSSCKSSLGVTQDNEGILSLERAFLQSGTKSIIASNWDIDDHSTSEIMSDFYIELAKGKSKSASLAHGKKAYLKHAGYFEEHPYFWAGIHLTGNSEPIRSESKKQLYWLFTLGVLGLLVFGLRRRFQS